MIQQEYYFKNALYSQNSQKKPNKTAEKTLIFLLFVTFGLIILGIFNRATSLSEKNLISPIKELQLPTEFKNAPFLSELIRSNFNFNDNSLSKIVLRRLENGEGDFAVVVEGLNQKSTKKFYFNDHKVLPSASLYKLFLIAATYRAIQNGELEETSIISVPEAHLIDILGSKEFGYEDIESINITYSVEELLSRIARISDNYASIMLAEKLGWDKIQEEAGNIGATSTSINSPITTTASDIALFFHKLYDKQIVSADSSEKIIDLLATAQINNRIPDKLPVGLKIAHKTGELAGVRHDAGIVFLSGNPYLIVLMGENLPGEDSGIELEASISKDVYDFFLNDVQSAP